jgi:metal-responsive CopG/Arc/MetJ family transcriptional regulator
MPNVARSYPRNRETKISIRLDNRVLEYFRSLVEQAGGGNYQTLINDALMAYIQQQSMLDTVRQAVREELRLVVEQAGLIRHCT